jgi:hypothetical protein
MKSQIFYNHQNLLPRRKDGAEQIEGMHMDEICLLEPLLEGAWKAGLKCLLESKGIWYA